MMTLRAPRVARQVLSIVFVAALMGLAGNLFWSGHRSWAAPPAGQAPTADAAASATAAEAVPQWIWAPPYAKDRVPVGTCYFRRSFNCGKLAMAMVQITCDDRYELLVNGRAAGRGSNPKQLDQHDIGALLTEGRNTIAVSAQNVSGQSAGLVARVILTSTDGSEQIIVTDSSWRAVNREFPNWSRPAFNDTSWAAAQEFSPLIVASASGAITPSGPTPSATTPSAATPSAAAPRTLPPEATSGAVAAVAEPPAARFIVKRNFRIEQVIKPEDTGSLIAMAFNEWGELLLSRENGSLLLVQDKDGDGTLDTVSTYSDEVKNCQGILPLNGEVYVMAGGPEGTGIYHLTNNDPSGKPRHAHKILGFARKMGEHGPHALKLGPDGWIYALAGNMSELEEGTADPNSPYRHYYEGDSVLPKYEDGGGHAEKVPAPGGLVVRLLPDGSRVERFAGGLRNAYDMAFSAEGELFTFDSDMEWDTGLPWYRSPRVLHITAGAEFGWRSGWAKWPEYYFDSMPSILATDRGSPTGAEFYNHHRYPSEYQGALMLGDWTMGQILAVRFVPDGGSYKASAEVLLQGQPLNVTALAVGPDGWLYFVTGGRGTEGGVYRVVYTGEQPAQPKLNPIGQAIRQPQFESAWGRQQAAAVQQQLGPQWQQQLRQVADAARNAPADRARAISLLQLFGPAPSMADAIRWSNDPQPEVRAKAALLLGSLATHDEIGQRLTELLQDPQPRIRRLACEAIVRGQYTLAVERLLPLLADKDRAVASAARLALLNQPTDRWRATVLGSQDTRIFLQGALALLMRIDERRVPVASETGITSAAPATKISLEVGSGSVQLATTAKDDSKQPRPKPSGDDAALIVDRVEALLAGYLSDQDFIDSLRVLQLALLRTPLSVERRQELARTFANEYPVKEPRINRELVRLFATLESSAALEKMLAQLEGDLPQVEKAQIAFHARFIKDGWQDGQRLSVLEQLESLRASEGAGHSMNGYIDNLERDFVAQFSPADQEVVLSRADVWPGAALAALALLPEKLSADRVAALVELDSRMADDERLPAKRLRAGIVAILARSGDERSMEYLRESFQYQPERRQHLALGLAQQPDGENWPLLVGTLPSLEGTTAQEVLRQLATVDRGPDSPETIRQVIMAGQRLGKDGGMLAAKLLSHWSGERPYAEDAEWEVVLPAWQQWFAEKFPEAPPAELPTEPADSRYTLKNLLAHLEGNSGQQGHAARGAQVFVKAKCASCHSFAGHGEAVGPDLTTVTRRFQKKEILQSVLFPSLVISDQYASKSVLTSNGLIYTGIVGPASGDAITVLQPNGEKVVVQRDAIDEIVANPKSTMPEGLFDSLTLDEIADLFAYLGTPSELAQRLGPPRESAPAKQPSQADVNRQSNATTGANANANTEVATPTTQGANVAVPPQPKPRPALPELPQPPQAPEPSGPKLDGPRLMP